MNTDDSDQAIQHSRAREVCHVRATEGESVAMAAVEVVSEVVGESPTDLPPLHGRVDTDALDALFGENTDRRGTGRGHIEFTYADCQVTVYEDGEVVATPTGN